MSINPLEKKIDQMTGEVQSIPSISADAVEPEQLPEPLPYVDAPEEGEPVLVAGKIDLLKNVLKGAGKKAMPDGPPVGAPQPDPGPTQPVLPGMVPPKTPPTNQQFIKAKKQAQGGKPPQQVFNYDLITSEEGLNKAVEALAKESGIGYEKITLADAKARAEALGLGPEYIASMEEIAGGLKELPVQVLRAQAAMVTQTKRLNELSARIVAEGETPELQAQWLKEWALSAHIGQQAKNIQVAPAQALAVLNQGRPVLNTADLERLAADPNVSQQIKDAATAMAQTINDAARNELVDKLTKVGFVKDLWLSTWINGLLSGTGTHVVNITSSGAFSLINPITRTTAGMIGGVRQMFSGQPLADRVFIGEGLAGAAGYVQGSREALSMFWQALKTGTSREQRLTGSMEDIGGKLEIRQSASGLDATDYGFDGKLAKGLTLWSKFVGVPGRVLQASDEAFKAFGYRYELNAQAYRRAALLDSQLAEEGVDAAIREQLVASRFADLVKNPTEDIDLAAVDFSKMITFTRDLDGMALKLQQLSNSNVLAKTIFPFVRTPTWLISEGMQHSYFALLSKQWRTDMAAGGAKRDLAIAKFGLGSMTMTALTSLAVDGRITGSGSGNKNMRTVYERDGWRPYSLVLKQGEYDDEFFQYLSGKPGMDPTIGADGNLYISLRGFEPLSAIFAMAADYVEYARYEEDTDLIGQAAMGALFGLFQYITESPFMQGVSGLTGALGNHVGNPRETTKEVIDSIIGGLVNYGIGGSPVGAWSSMQAQIERYINGERSDIKPPPDLPVGVKGFYEAILRWKSRVPGLSSDLPDRLNRWGEPDMQVDPQRPWLGFLGIRTSESKMKEVDRVLIALGVPLGMPQRRISWPDSESPYSGVSTKLNSEEYNRMLTLYSQEVKIAGIGVQQAIVEMAKTPGFDQLDLDKQQTLIQSLDNEFMSAAKKMLIIESPEIQMRLEDEKFKLGLHGKFKN